VQNYFSGPASKYDENDFERRFRMPRSVFNKIQENIIGKGLFVDRKMNFSGQKGVHPLVRLTACLRRLAIHPTEKTKIWRLPILPLTRA
jgi:hypothetical protein